jgi:hypothetical protein
VYRTQGTLPDHPLRPLCPGLEDGCGNVATCGGLCDSCAEDAWGQYGPPRPRRRPFDWVVEMAIAFICALALICALAG